MVLFNSDPVVLRLSVHCESKVPKTDHLSSSLGFLMVYQMWSVYE